MESNRRALLGIILILVGGALLLENLDMLPGIPEVVFSWGTLFLVIALFNLVSGNRSAAVIFVAISAFLYARRYWDVDLSTYWPLILIVIGLSFILRRRTSGEARLSDSFFDDINVFGGGDKRVSSQAWQGGRVTTVFGGADIDLTQATPVSGATVEVFIMFGGIDLIVPSGWKVVSSVTSIFGAFTDERKTIDAPDGPVIYVKGMVIFGGGAVKSVK